FGRERAGWTARGGLFIQEEQQQDQARDEQQHAAGDGEADPGRTRTGGAESSAAGGGGAILSLAVGTDVPGFLTAGLAGRLRRRLLGRRPRSVVVETRQAQAVALLQAVPGRGDRRGAAHAELVTVVGAVALAAVTAVPHAFTLTHVADHRAP